MISPIAPAFAGLSVCGKAERLCVASREGSCSLRHGTGSRSFRPLRRSVVPDVLVSRLSELTRMCAVLALPLSCICHSLKETGPHTR